MQSSFTPAVNLGEGSHSLYVQERDEAGNWYGSGSAPVTIDLTPLEAPRVVGSTPVSPANHNNPLIQGTSEADCTVRLYTTAECSTAHVVSGSAEDFALLGLAVSVLDDSATRFYATATDAAGNTSGCSETNAMYVEESCMSEPWQSVSIPWVPSIHTQPRPTATCAWCIRPWADTSRPSSLANARWSSARRCWRPITRKSPRHWAILQRCCTPWANTSRHASWHSARWTSSCLRLGPNTPRWAMRSPPWDVHWLPCHAGTWQLSIFPELAMPLLGLGELHLARHKPAEAVVVLERALSLNKLDPSIRLNLATALWSANKDKQRAVALAREVRAEAEANGHEPMVAQAARWLGDHVLSEAPP